MSEPEPPGACGDVPPNVEKALADLHRSFEAAVRRRRRLSLWLMPVRIGSGAGVGYCVGVLFDQGQAVAGWVLLMSAAAYLAAHFATA